MLTHTGTKTIDTERLRLRRFRREDAQAMFDNWASDDEVTRFLSWPTHTDVSISQFVIDDWVNSYQKDETYLWAITFRDKDIPIGSISVVSHNDRVGKMEIGYCIGKAWWHQGIMTEALGAVMNVLFNEVGANRLEASHDANNPNSGAVMSKCGMLFEGTLRRSGCNNQGICDVCWYAAIRN